MSTAIGLALEPAALEELREAAVAYALLGWRVVPVHPPTAKVTNPGKQPSDGDGWQTEKFRRTAETVRDHWREPFNVGVLLGPESGDLVDVDLDCPEALTFADDFLLGGALVFGRAGALRSHRLYRAPNAHLLQLHDLPEPGQVNGKMIVELRAKPTGAAGAQSVFPPSIHSSGERIEWAEDNDGRDLPAVVDTAELFRSVRCVAVAAFLARHLGGVEEARRYLENPRASALPREVYEHAELLAGREPAGRTRGRHEPTKAGPVADLRAAGIEATAAVLGLEWDPRRKALVVCPQCGADTRSDRDKRAAAGVVLARDTGVELWIHGKCGGGGDAVKLAALTLVARMGARE